jgi:hypothetical protein
MKKTYRILTEMGPSCALEPFHGRRTTLMLLNVGSGRIRLYGKSRSHVTETG